MILDFFGNEIKIGDTVAFMQLGYRTLLIGIVDSIAAQTLIIKHDKTNTGKTESRQFHNQVIVRK